MDFVIYAMFLVAVFALFLVGRLTKSNFFPTIASILLIMVSLWVLQLGLQLQTGQTTTIAGAVETIVYDYTEITFDGIILADVLGVSGILVGLYLIASTIINIWR